VSLAPEGAGEVPRTNTGLFWNVIFQSTLGFYPLLDNQSKVFFQAEFGPKLCSAIESNTPCEFVKSSLNYKTFSGTGFP
jgi:hypothetical protein